MTVQEQLLHLKAQLTLMAPQQEPEPTVFIITDEYGLYLSCVPTSANWGYYTAFNMNRSKAIECTTRASAESIIRHFNREFCSHDLKTVETSKHKDQQ